MISYLKLYFNFPKELWATSSLRLSNEPISSGIPLSHSASLFSQFPIYSFEIRHPIFKNHLLSLQMEEVPSLPPFLGLTNMEASAGGAEVVGTGLRSVVSIGEEVCVILLPGDKRIFSNLWRHFLVITAGKLLRTLHGTGQPHNGDVSSPQG